MDGIATFLLGGAVGVALGYLASRKRSHKSVTTMPGRPIEAPPGGPSTAAEEPALLEETLPEGTAPAEGVAVLEAVPWEEAVLEEGVVEEPLVEEPLVEEPLADELLGEGLLAERVLSEGLPAPEVIAPEVLAEEPLARELLAEGVETEPAVEEAVAEGAVAEEAAEVETISGLMAAEPLAAEEASAEKATVETPAAPQEEIQEEGVGLPSAAVVEEPESATLAAELPLEKAAEPVSGSAWDGYAAPETAGVLTDIPGFTDADLAEIEFVDLAALETQVAEAVEAEVAEIAEAPEQVAAQPEASLETVVSVEPEVTFEREAVLEGAASIEVEAPPVTSSVDDLKARIEETRRRIRRELEQPFVSFDEVEHTQDWTVSPVIPVAEEAVEPEPVEFEPAEPSVVEPEAVEPAVAELETPEPPVDEFETFEPETVSPSVEAIGLEGTPEDALAEVLDYDSMKSRIEVTRSRLKAKAFDAMMTGESALLGREPEDAQPRKPVTPVVDSEIDQTIETGLREQED